MSETDVSKYSQYARNWKERPDEFDYLLVDLVDKSTQKITQSFGPCFEYIEKARNETKGRPPRILIHCVQGKSRSVTIAIAYLMMKEGITVDEALDQIREVRDVVHTPNKGFMKQLYEYEKKLGLSKRSMPYSVQPGAEVSRAPTTTVPNCERRPSKDDLICKQGTEEMRSRSSGEDDKSNGFRSSGCGSLRPESPARSQGNEKASLQNLGIISVSRANRTLSSGRRKIDRLLVQLPRR
ncbi:hypothetical protein AAMO2058_000104200 [Amorphochlora amoebiformis]